MALWKQTKNITIIMPEELLDRVDEAARANFMSRSEYIRFVLHEAIKLHQPKTIFDRNYVGGIKPEWLDLDGT